MQLLGYRRAAELPSSESDPLGAHWFLTAQEGRTVPCLSSVCLMLLLLEPERGAYVEWGAQAIVQLKALECGPYLGASLMWFLRT